MDPWVTLDYWMLCSFFNIIYFIVLRFVYPWAPEELRHMFGYGLSLLALDQAIRRQPMPEALLAPFKAVLGYSR